MNTTVHRRLALLAALLLLSLLVFAIGVHVEAAAVGESGAGSGRSAASVTTPPAGTQGRGVVVLAPLAAATGSEPASSGMSSTTAWIVAGSLAAVLLAGIGALALVRRLRTPGKSPLQIYCTRHPEAPLCGAA